MKHIFLKTALAALLMGGVATSCVNDLNISSIDQFARCHLFPFVL